MDKCNAMDLLKTHNLKSTKQRLALLGVILEVESLFTAKILFDRLKEKMDLVTIYRILDVLKSKGIVREILSSDESKMYELSCKHNPVHPHFSCSECGQILCLKELNNDFLMKFINDFPNYLIEDISIQLTGKCPNCKIALTNLDKSRYP